MAQKHIYSNKNLKIIQIISLIVLLLITYTTAEKFYNLFHKKIDETYTTIDYLIITLNYILNFVLIIFSAILLKHPQKFFLIGIECLAYSLAMSIVNSDAFLSLIMLCVTFSTLLLRNNFAKIKKHALIAFILLYLFELFIPLREGFDIFIDVFFKRIGASILLGFLLFFIFEYAKQISVKAATKDKVLNLASYNGLDRSDMYLLQDVLDNKKYKEIAQEIHGSEGALRNKLSKIYKILEVGDRTGFLSIYSGYELIYEPESETTVTN